MSLIVCALWVGLAGCLFVDYLLFVVYWLSDLIGTLVWDFLVVDFYWFFCFGCLLSVCFVWFLVGIRWILLCDLLISGVLYLFWTLILI